MENLYNELSSVINLSLQLGTDFELDGGEVVVVDGIEAIILRVGAGLCDVPVVGFDADCLISVERTQVGRFD